MKQSEKTKRKISNKLKGVKKPVGFGVGRKQSEETKRKIGETQKRIGNKPPSSLGITRSEETRKKISEIQRGKHHSPKTEFKKGHTISEEHKRKISETHKGKKLSNETKNKLSEIHKKLGSRGPVLFGKNHPAWQGGISFEPYSLDWTRTLRLAIRQRDNFTCQKCGITEEEHLKKLGRILSVNHVDFNKKNCDPNNLNTLCVACNTSINFNRDYWTNYFQQKLCLV